MLAALTSQLGRHGLDLVKPFNVAWYNAAVEPRVSHFIVFTIPTATLTHATVILSMFGLRFPVWNDTAIVTITNLSFSNINTWCIGW
jgi:hypothetical protein